MSFTTLRTASYSTGLSILKDLSSFSCNNDTEYFQILLLLLSELQEWRNNKDIYISIFLICTCIKDSA
jgi:hypothetical protein